MEFLGKLPLSALWGEPAGQTWLQLAELGLAFVLSGLIGLERELRQKSAGLRTYTIVGFASALIVLVSKYGFTNILAPDRIVVDPSRIAAQIVSGIGFIGGGVIFVRKDIVRGLTTAATVWITAAIGMACGAGLPVLAIAVTAGHFLVIAGFPMLERRLPKSRWSAVTLRISYWDGRGVLRDVLALCTEQEFVISRLEVESQSASPAAARSDSAHQPANMSVEAFAAAGRPAPTEPSRAIVALLLELRGARSLSNLVARLSEIDGVVAVRAGEDSFASE